MKKKIYFIALFAMTLLCSKKINAQANQSLSNLTSPTAVNVSLLPGTNGTLDLGSNAKKWRSLYLGTSIYFKGALTMQSPNGTSNFFIGPYSGKSTLTGYYNNGFGSYALGNLTNGLNNTAAGYAAGYFTNSGFSNTAMGYYSMFYTTSGYDNVAIGSQALYRNTIGHNHVAVGDSALFNQDENRFDLGGNTAVGSKALFTNTSSYWNVAVGEEALYANDQGISNTAIGDIALTQNTTGEYNTSVGRLSMYQNTSGNYCTALGAALYYNVTGNYNTALGYGADVYYLYGNLTNATAVGNSATVDASNKVRIGNTAVTSIGGQVGWSIFSDGRYKKNIKENVPGLSFINALNPITYTVDVNSLNNYFHADKPELTKGPDENSAAAQKAKAAMQKSYEEAAKVVYTGFIAQDVEKAATQLGFDFSGVDKPQAKEGMYGLRYDNFVVPLVKAVQQLSALNDEKDTRLDAEQKQIDDLQKQVNDLKILIQSNTQINSSSLKATGNNSGSSIVLQNIPNPFSGTTVINYLLPQKFTNAQILITDKSGKTLKQFTLTASGSVQFDATLLAAGTYNYSLMIDGKMIDSKQMILVK